MMPKPNTYLSKIYQKVHSIVSQKFEVYIDQKYEKWKSNKKLSIKCKHFGGESYMFITRENFQLLVRIPRSAF